MDEEANGKGGEIHRHSCSTILPNLVNPTSFTTPIDCYFRFLLDNPSIAK